jgi:tungstate transport system ATP-binding protein
LGFDLDPTTERAQVNPLVELRDLQVRRGKQVALQLDELIIQPNEVLAVVGPNGAGKSTLLLTLARLLKPESGNFLFKGQPVAGLSETEYRRQIALVMQDALLFDMPVFNNVALGLRFRGAAKLEIQRSVLLWLERLGVPHLARRRAGELSGGEAQRVSLARALALEPEMLLLDEPFSSLDPPTRSRLLVDLGALLAETATTTVFVTHNLAEVGHFARRLAVILDNRLCQTGTMEDILAAPADGVAEFLER